jgi:hypothetical protein
MAYHDAIRHDGPALELAELVDDELGPALVTVLFTDAGSSGDAEVRLTSCRSSPATWASTPAAWSSATGP